MNCYYFSVFDMKVKDIPRQEDALKWLIKASADLGLLVLSYTQMTFPAPVSGNAYTLAAILAESHAIVHTAPESSWVEVIFALCKEVPKGKILEKVTEFWSPEVVKVSSFIGSIPEVS